ncbi:MAG TPA: copper chaperone PCu(A)C [Pseudolabrys sp.]|nr:copper chaperone PCu(A)C [Pseudolabrys sp.]
MTRTATTRTAMIVAAVIATWAALPAQAQDVTVGSLKIFAAWARATPKGASVGGGYMKITNTGSAPDRLIGGSTDIASRFEIHDMKMDNGVMKMRPVSDGLEIKPGQTVELAPGGYHAMLVGLKQQLEQGQHFKATLEFAKAGKVDVDFAVEGIGAQSPAPAGGATPGMGGMKMK